MNIDRKEINDQNRNPQATNVMVKRETKCIIHRYDANGNKIDTRTYPIEDLRRMNVKYHGKEQGGVEQAINLEFKSRLSGEISLQNRRTSL